MSCYFSFLFRTNSWINFVLRLKITLFPKLIIDLDQEKNFLKKLGTYMLILRIRLLQCKNLLKSKTLNHEFH